jgi:uncharacterized lipoprotein YehR (DUF1307 family)
MKNKFKKIILLLCTALILSFSIIGCGNSDSNNEDMNTATSTPTDAIDTDDSGNNTSNYSQEFEIDESDGNATSPQAYDSIDLG